MHCYAICRAELMVFMHVCRRRNDNTLALINPSTGLIAAGILHRGFALSTPWFGLQLRTGPPLICYCSGQCRALEVASPLPVAKMDQDMAKCWAMHPFCAFIVLTAVCRNSLSFSAAAAAAYAHAADPELAPAAAASATAGAATAGGGQHRGH
jgi:hypothetical protein